MMRMCAGATSCNGSGSGKRRFAKGSWIMMTIHQRRYCIEVHWTHWLVYLAANINWGIAHCRPGFFYDLLWWICPSACPDAPLTQSWVLLLFRCHFCQLGSAKFQCCDYLNWCQRFVSFLTRTNSLISIMWKNLSHGQSSVTTASDFWCLRATYMRADPRLIEKNSHSDMTIFQLII